MPEDEERRAGRKGEQGETLVGVHTEDVNVECTEQSDRWAFPNRVLCDLYKRHPDHEHRDIVIAKVWLICKAYAAAVERRKPSSGSLVANDPSYENYVAPASIDSRLDQCLSPLR